MPNFENVNQVQRCCVYIQGNTNQPGGLEGSVYVVKRGHVTCFTVFVQSVFVLGPGIYACCASCKKIKAMNNDAQ